MNRQLKKDVKDYVKKGGKDAFAFSITHTPKYDMIPGQMIQLMIDGMQEGRECSWHFTEVFPKEATTVTYVHELDDVSNNENK